MNKKKYLITLFTLSIFALILIFPQINQNNKAFANIFNYESLAQYVKLNKTTTSPNTTSLIDESKYAEYYYFKKHLTNLNLTDSEAKEQAYNQILEETVLLETAKKENLLGTQDQALKMSAEVRSILKNEAEENKDVIQNINEIIKGLDITEDQYFNEFLINSYITTISIDNLHEEVTKDYEDEVKEVAWDKFKQSEVKKFINRNKEDINEFRSIHNIK